MAPFKNIFFGGFQSIKTNKIEKTALSDSAAGISVTVSGQKVFEPGNGYIYHIFTAPGTFVVRYGGYADILLVGGGGGGGGGDSTVKGGGGGAGGFREELNVFLPIQDYPIIIGSGGSGNTGPGVSGTLGGSTTFNSQPVPTGGVPFTVGGSPVTQILIGGGGGGGGGPNINGVTAPLGSGGGGAGNGGDGGGASPLYGNPGGGPITPNPPSYAGGGGGGAGAPGGTGGGPSSPLPSAYGGNGGAGLAAFSGDTGIPTDYGTPGPTPGRWFAGGGGGAGSPSQGTYAGDGGAGGGGGDPHYTRTAFNTGLRIDGLENTGGGGMGYHYPFSSGNGAPGIVIIRYLVTD